MFHWTIRYLAFSSLIAISTGCGTSPYLHLQKKETAVPCISNLKPQFSTVLYNAQVNVSGRHLSGLLLFKSMPDQTTQVVFTNEMGVTYFHFEYRENGFRVVSILDKMNKKVVINRLKDDLGLLLMHNNFNGPPEVFQSGNDWYYRFFRGKEQVFYITDESCNILKSIETASDKKKKIVVNMTSYSSGMADSVYLAHQSFEYNITLKQISR